MGARKTRPLDAGAIVARKFELVACIAEGGMGSVWIARNVATSADVALKVLLPHREDDERAGERFRHEAKVGAMLAHRNITRVFDLIEEDDGSLVLIMELLEGRNLRDYYREKGSLPAREAVAILVAVLSALQHAHDHGIVHRDLKPTNIFLHVDTDGHVTPKLLDFGIAKGRDSSVETKTGDALGTPSYMSPEQVRAIPLDGRSDLFSAAVVLYEILTGENPFDGATATAVLAQVLELEIDPDPRIDPRVWLELQRALSKQSYQRHASAKELAAALCAAIGEGEVALAASLQQAPSLPRVRLAPVPGDATIRTSTSQLAIPASRRVGRALLAGAGAALVVTVVAALAVRGSGQAQAPAPTTEPAPSVVMTTGPIPTPSATPSTIESAAPDEPKTAGSAPRRPHHAPPPARLSASGSARPLARTPGF